MPTLRRSAAQRAYVTLPAIAKASLTKNDALAAVTVPCGLMNAGFNLAMSASVDTRTPLSLSMRPVEKVSERAACAT